MAKKNIKKGDLVEVLTGADRGKKAKVLRILEERALVEGLNLKKRRVKSRQEGEKGQVVEVPHPFHLSNLAVVCSNCKRGRRIRIKLDKNKKTRVCSKCEKAL